MIEKILRVFTLAATLLAGPALAAEMPTVEIHTNMGVITVELNAEKAPISVANFLRYVDSGFYENTIFHRVISEFMVQGGGLTEDMRKKRPLNDPIKNESRNGLKNDRGTIAMARTPKPHSATSQFYINLKNNDQLNYPSFDNWGYAVFGKVTAGMDVVDAIAAIRTAGRNGRANVPTKTVIIEKIIRINNQ